MKIMIGCDHGGLELKERLIPLLQGMDHDLEDIGTFGPQSVDYPAYAARVARAVADGKADRGVLLCGSGIGMCITANRFPGVRAVQASNPYEAKMSRRHNDCNVLCLGGRFLGDDLAREILETWLREGFEGGRHQRRVEQIDALTGG